MVARVSVIASVETLQIQAKGWWHNHKDNKLVKKHNKFGGDTMKWSRYIDRLMEKHVATAYLIE